MRKIKKLICGAISCAFAASLLGGIALGVTAADDFSVKISSEKAEPGESYTLTMDMENIPSPGINVCEFAITYNSSLVTVDSVELGSLADNITVEDGMPSPFAYVVDTDVIDVVFSDVSGTVLSGSGTFLNIKGTVKSTAADGSEAEFKIVPIERAATPGSGTANEKVIFGYIDENFVEYTPLLVSGKVSVGETATTEPVTTTVTTTTTQPVTTTTTELTTTIATQPVTTTVTNPGTTIATQPVTTVITQLSTTISTQPVTTASTARTTATTAKTTAKTTASTIPTTTTTPTTTVVTDKLRGDVNLDGYITLADVIIMQKYFVKAKEFNAEQFAAADFNADGFVNIFDVVALKRYIVYNW